MIYCAKIEHPTGWLAEVDQPTIFSKKLNYATINTMNMDAIVVLTEAPPVRSQIKTTKRIYKYI